jgi:hypothetical protein
LLLRQDVPFEAYPKDGKEAWERYVPTHDHADLVCSRSGLTHHRLKIGNERFASGDLAGFLGNLATEIHPDARKNLSASQVCLLARVLSLSLSLY